MQAAKAKGLKVLMVVQSTPPWANGGQGPTTPPSDPASFGAAMGGFAARLPGVDAWELWNEEDGAIFWAGGTDPAKYAAMVKAAYPAIKAAQPHDIVVTGATVGNNMDFIAQLYEHGIKGSFDAVGVHTDTACLIERPGRQLPRRARPRRPLLVHGLPRGPRRDGPQRRRRQADLDDRARLEHADDGARLVQRRRVGGAEAARRQRGRAGRSS